MLVALSIAAPVAARASAEPPPSPPPDLADRTRGAWVDVYRAWMERPGGTAIPVDPGPAFCVGADGLVLIDQNAVAEALHLFATVGGRGPFAARARAYDARAGLVAIQLSPIALEDTPCLPGILDGAEVPAAGDVLFALGPAGAQPVPLRVRKVAPEGLTFVGGLPERFLAGSPLVDANGSIRGVLVAGTSGGWIGEARATGPLAGLAKRRRATGAILASQAAVLARRLEILRGEGVPVPPADPVVRSSEGVFPRALRAAPAVSGDDLSLYFARSDEAGAEFLTPASLEAQGSLHSYAYAAGRTFFAWPEHAQMWEAAVVVQSSPRFEPATGSKAKVVFDPIAIERGSAPVEPLDAFVECFDGDASVEEEPSRAERRHIKGCRTYYLYAPEAFAPGAGVVVRATLDGGERTAEVPVRTETLARIAADFAPWRDVVRDGRGSPGGPAPVAIVAPPPDPGVPYATTSQGSAELRITMPAGTFVVTRTYHAGEPVMQFPAVRWKSGMFSAAIPGFLVIGRNEISFAPLTDAHAEKKAFAIPRAGLVATQTIGRQLLIKGGGKKRHFILAVVGTQSPTISEVLGTARSQAQAAAVTLALKLLGDFDQALRAFDDPGILATMPPPPPGASPFDAAP